MNKPREFWVCKLPNNQHRIVDERPEVTESAFLHVIEKSAADTLADEVERVCQAHKYGERHPLVKAYKKYRGTDE